MQKIYIAGKITGEENYRQKFKAAQDELEARGYRAMNPAILPPGFAYEDYMHICFAMIDVCDAVYFLADWRDSPGATREHEYASRLGKVIEHEEVSR